MTHELKIAGEEYFDRQNALFIYAETPIADLKNGNTHSTTYHRAVGDNALAHRNRGSNRSGLLAIAKELSETVEQKIGHTNEVPRSLKLAYSEKGVQITRRPLNSEELMLVHENTRELKNPGLYLKTDFSEAA